MWFIKFELGLNFLLVIEFVCVEFVREFGSEYGHACTFHVDPEIFKEGDVGQHLFFNGFPAFTHEILSLVFNLLVEVGTLFLELAFYKLLSASFLVGKYENDFDIFLSIHKFFFTCEICMYFGVIFLVPEVFDLEQLHLVLIVGKELSDQPVVEVICGVGIGTGDRESQDVLEFEVGVEGGELLQLLS